MENISAEQAAKLLGIGIEDVKKLEKQGILHPTKHEKTANFYSPQEISQIKSRDENPTIADEAARIGNEILKNTVSSISFARKILLSLGTVALGCLILVIILTILFIASPIQTATWLGFITPSTLPSSAP